MVNVRATRRGNTAGLLYAVIITACLFHTVHSQFLNLTDLMSGTNSSNIDILTLLNDLNIQKIIGDMQGDGTLAELANSFAAASGASFSIQGKCLGDMLTMIRGVSNFDLWAVKMIDAIGKPPSGIVSDIDLNWIGAFDECVGVQAITYSNDTLQSDPVSHFHGKYCKIGIPIGSTIMGLLGPEMAAFFPNINVGMCMPDSCNTEDVKNLMDFVGKNVFNASSDYKPECECHDGHEIESKTIVAIVILSIIGVVVVIGTLYDICLNLKTEQEVEENKPANHANGDLNNGEAKVNLAVIIDELNDGKSTGNGKVVMPNEKPIPVTSKPNVQYSTLEKVFLAFSVYTNGKKILSTNQPKGALTCINGIRFFSMTWVILGHSIPFNSKNSIPFWFQKKVWQWTFYGIYVVIIFAIAQF